MYSDDVYFVLAVLTGLGFVANKGNLDQLTFRDIEEGVDMCLAVALNPLYTKECDTIKRALQGSGFNSLKHFLEVARRDASGGVEGSALYAVISAIEEKPSCRRAVPAKARPAAEPARHHAWPPEPESILD